MPTCHRDDGRPKVRHSDPADAERIATEIMARSTDGILRHYYRCPRCHFWHVGRAGTRSGERPAPPDPIDVLELGERAEACMRLESSGSQSRRLAHIRKRFQAAERRRLHSPLDGESARVELGEPPGMGV